MKKILLSLLLSSLILSACQSKSEDKPTQVMPEIDKVTAPKSTEVDNADIEQQAPPTPPLYEDFQATPQISLFPRTGSFKPEDADENGLPFWRTYIDHLTRTSGPFQTGTETEPNTSFGFRAIKGLDSVGVFSPIAVSPKTSYEVNVLMSCDLTDDASAGIGVLEFKEFLWIGEQFSESMAKEHQVGTQQGIKLSGKVEKQAQSFTFTTGPQTRMIHLVFFRDGAQDRNPVVIDDIKVTEVRSEK